MRQDPGTGQLQAPGLLAFVVGVKASRKSRWKIGKRSKAIRNNTKAERLNQTQRRLRKQAARLQNVKKPNGSTAEKEEEGDEEEADESARPSPVSNSDEQYSLLATTVQRKLRLYLPFLFLY